jgi:hypothetical protein
MIKSNNSTLGNKDSSSNNKNIFLTDNAILVCLALTKFFIHFLTNVFGGYGYFRDEFYYIACSDHIAWGYVDQPPLSIAILWLNRLFFGDSLVALRLLPAVAGAIVVIMAGLMARELGGKRFSQMLAAISVIASPQILGTNSIFTMNSFDILFWTVALYFIILVMKNNDPKYWLILGVVFGLGLLNKISVLWLGAGLAAGLLITDNRKLYKTKEIWITALMALLIFSPYVIWQIANDFPTIEFIRNATVNKYVAVSPLQMFTEQTLTMNPLTFPIWFSGLIFLLISKSMRRFQILPVIYITVFLILVINKNSKAEYLGPLFPMLFSVGAYTIEKIIAKLNWRWLKPVILTFILIFGIGLAPFAIPILPVDTFIAYMPILGISSSTSEKKEVSKLPQYYADMFGWEKMAAVVADAYNTLTPEEKAKCAIIGNNYGEAGAIDFFGKKYNLPKTISGHNNYWLWGHRNATGGIVIRLGGSMEAMLESYSEAKQVGLFHDDYCMPYENKMAIYVCKNRRIPLKDDWADFKHFD